MSVPVELWKNWESRLVDGKFPLRQWLGSSDHSAVFLTERGGKESKTAAIKLIAAENLDEDAQLSHWADAARLSHPHLIRLFECGRCELDDTRLLYVVMELAEEDLSQILPLRALSRDEVSEMLVPAAEALDFLHRAGFAHGHIQPSNIMAVDNQLKISADGVRKSGERTNAHEPGAYDAPEVRTAGLSPAADTWSLGITLAAVLTQQEPKPENGDPGQAGRLLSVPEPFHGMVRDCLQSDPKQRCTASDILRRLQAPAISSASVVKEREPKRGAQRWIILAIAAAALFLIALAGRRFMVHPPRIPAAQNDPASPPNALPNVPAAQSPAPFSEKEKPAQAMAPGSVLQQVLPDVSQSARNTIEGRVKVNIRVAVDASGSVSKAELASPARSKYFANLALAAARRWKFGPPQVNGEATASEWILRFQFGRTSTQVFSAEVNP